MTSSTELIWPHGLAQALITSDLATVQVNLIFATGVIPADLKENP